MNPEDKKREFSSSTTIYHSLVRISNEVLFFSFFSQSNEVNSINQPMDVLDNLGLGGREDIQQSNRGDRSGLPCPCAEDIQQSKRGDRR